MISIERLKQSLGEDIAIALSDDDRSGSADETVLVAALDIAEGCVADELRRGGYTPSDSPEGLIEELIIALAVERLYLRRREMMPSVWEDRAKTAWLVARDIGDGRRTMAGAPRTCPRIVPPGGAVPLHRLDSLQDF